MRRLLRRISEDLGGPAWGARRMRMVSLFGMFVNLAGQPSLRADDDGDRVGKVVHPCRVFDLFE